MADFGLARSLNQLTDTPVGNGDLTDYVATRWYRAPEILVGSTWYAFTTKLWENFPSLSVCVCVLTAKNEKLIEYVCHARILDLSSGNFRVCFLCGMCYVEKGVLSIDFSPFNNTTLKRQMDGVSIIITWFQCGEYICMRETFCLM